MNLIANNGRLYNMEGNQIEPLESGICVIGNRRFVFEKLYAFILKKKGEGNIPQLKIKRKRGRPKQRQIMHVHKIKKPKTNEHRKQCIIARSMKDGKEIVFESHTKAAEQLGISRGNISMTVAKKRAHAGGYVFEKLIKSNQEN